MCDCGVTKEIPAGRVTNKNITSCGCQKKLPEKEASFNHLYDKYRRGALYREYEFKLTKEEFRTLTSSNCFYCNIEPHQKVQQNTYNGQYTYNGIDRVDNKLGYTIDNVVPCCGVCNQLKGSLDTKIFIEKIKLIYENVYEDS